MKSFPINKNAPFTTKWASRTTKIMHAAHGRNPADGPAADLEVVATLTKIISNILTQITAAKTLAVLAADRILAVAVLVISSKVFLADWAALAADRDLDKISGAAVPRAKMRVMWKQSLHLIWKMPTAAAICK